MIQEKFDSIYLQKVITELLIKAYTLSYEYFIVLSKAAKSCPFKILISLIELKC